MSDILARDEDAIRTVTLARVDKKNAITAAMYAALADALATAAADDGVRVALLRGHEAVFSAGNDLVDFLEHPPAGTDAPVFRFLRALATFPKPLVAAVCGPAVGVGTTLLFHCDLVYAGDNASFSMPFVDLGLCPEAGSSLLAPRLLGHQRAAQALLLGESFGAEEAQRMGLVNRVLPAAEVDAATRTAARRLAAKPSSSLVETKRLLKQGQAEALLARIAEEAATFGTLLRGPAAREALTAFKERRRPDFSRL